VDPDASSTWRELGIVGCVSSYTRSMEARFAGPKPLRRKMYRNLQTNETDEERRPPLITSWTPLTSVVRELRNRFASSAVFFFNDLSPEVIGVLWRPRIFDPKPFSIMASEGTMPSESGWKSDSFLTRNARDILRDMSQYYQHVVTNVKIFDYRGMAIDERQPKRLKTGREGQVYVDSDDE